MTWRVVGVLPKVTGTDGGDDSDVVNVILISSLSPAPNVVTMGPAIVGLEIMTPSCPAEIFGVIEQSPQSAPAAMVAPVRYAGFQVRLNATVFSLPRLCIVIGTVALVPAITFWLPTAMSLGEAPV